VTTYTFSAPDVNGIRTATASGSVLAGNSRRFLVNILASGVLIDAIEGVANIPANSVTTVDLSRYTTATSRIFREMYKISVSKTLTIDPTAVQAIVDSLTNTNHTTGAPLGAGPQINAFNIHPNNLVYTRLASMIANGEGSGAPWTPPAPANIPAAVVAQFQAAQESATTTVNLITAAGLPVTQPCIFSLNDWISSAVTTTNVNTATATFTGINIPYNIGQYMPNKWTATAINTVTGDKMQQDIFPANGSNLLVNLSMPANPAKWFAGSGGGWTGLNNLHPAVATIENQGALAARNGKVYFVDTNTGGRVRLRKIDTFANGQAVVDIAGTGNDGTAFDATNPFNIAFNSHSTGGGLSASWCKGLAIDSNDRLYVADAGNRRIIRLTPGGTNGYTAEIFFSTLNQSGSIVPYNLSVYNDGTKDWLYAGTLDHIYTFDLTAAVPNLGPNGGYNESTTNFNVGNPGGNYEGVYPTRTGNFLFFNYPNGVKRRDITNNTEVVVIGGGSSTTSGTIGNLANVSYVNGLYVTSNGVLFMMDTNFKFSRLSNATGADPTQMILSTLGTDMHYIDWGLCSDGTRFYYRNAARNQILEHQP